MAPWSGVEAEAPDLARRARALFDAHLHKTIATLRRDGSPRISGTEATFARGELWLGMMPNSLKALDLRRDARLALHSATVDPEMAEGDAKLSGRAIEVLDPERRAAFMGASGEDGGDEVDAFHLFRVDVVEVVVTRVADSKDHLVIERWREGDGIKQMSRK